MLMSTTVDAVVTGSSRARGAKGTTSHPPAMRRAVAFLPVVGLIQDHVVVAQGRTRGPVERGAGLNVVTFGDDFIRARLRQVALAQDHVVARGHADLELLPLVFEGALFKDARLTSRLVTDPRLSDGDPGGLDLLPDAVLQLTQADFRLAQNQSIVREVGAGGPVAQRNVKFETDAVVRKFASENLR